MCASPSASPSCFSSSAFSPVSSGPASLQAWTRALAVRLWPGQPWLFPRLSLAASRELEGAPPQASLSFPSQRAEALPLVGLLAPPLWPPARAVVPEAEEAEEAQTA